MDMMRGYRLTLLVVLMLAGPTGFAAADTSCRGGQTFDAWLADFRSEAAGKGISERALSALDAVGYDERVFRQDRGQTGLSQSFLDFADRAVTAERLSRGRTLLQEYSSTFARVEREYGVPAPVILALWALETDYGGFLGNFPILTSLATLAYDCRRPDLFRAELLAALGILDGGDLRASQLKGSWAGAVGHLQFTPTTYLNNAVDGDGDGRRDLVGSVPDALASAGKYIRSLGWRAGEPWLEEVRVADTAPWQEAAREIFRKRSFWAAAGVIRADGSALPADGMEAALILPMGRLGPAFLAYRNFLVFWEWNNSSNYILSVAYLATRIGGAPRMDRGNAPPILSSDAMREVQERLNAMGFDAGTPDGRLGETTRRGVKQAQLKFGLPADGYPTSELLQRLRGQ
jgi:lytic murein transglycosylase